MPEFEQLFELKEYLYKEACPVVIKQGELLLDPESKSIYAVMTVKNIIDKVITSALMDIHVFDKANKEIEVLRDYQYFGLEAARDDEFGADTHISIISSTGYTFSVAVKRIVFNDETEWVGTPSLLFENLPRRVTLMEELEDEATVEQYQRNFCEKLAENKEVTPQIVPAVYKDLWICACGEINHSEEEVCFACGAKYEPQKEMIDNRVQLAADLTEYNRLQAELAEKARLEAERKAAEEAAAKAEAERKAAEEAERARLREIRRKRRNKIIAAITIPAVILAIIYAILHVTYIKPTMEYNAAKELVAAGKYDEAITAFTALNGFSDSEDAILDAKYKKAAATFNSGKYDEAIVLFNQIIDYKDSQAQIYEIEYEKALDVMDNGDYDMAIELFGNLSPNKDCSAEIEECWYLKGMAIVAEDLDTAKTCYAELSSANYISDMQKAFCYKGVELYTAENDKNAELYFEMVTDEELYNNVKEAYYTRAINFIDKGKYKKALAILDGLTDYSDVPQQIKRAHFLRGNYLFKKDQFEDAKSEYKAAGDYEGAADKITECDYQLACQLFNSRDYKAAAPAFAALGEYKDSIDMFNEATYQYGYYLLNQGEVREAYDTLYAIKDYYPAWYLLIRNSQFYIHIYDRGVGPNPLDE